MFHCCCHWWKLPEMCVCWPELLGVQNHGSYVDYLVDWMFTLLMFEFRVLIFRFFFRYFSLNLVFSLLLLLILSLHLFGNISAFGPDSSSGFPRGNWRNKSTTHNPVKENGSKKKERERERKRTTQMIGSREKKSHKPLAPQGPSTINQPKLMNWRVK